MEKNINLSLKNIRFKYILYVSKLQHLPYTLVNMELKAVWLTENQAQLLLTFQTDSDETTEGNVLIRFFQSQLCYTQEPGINVLILKSHEALWMRCIDT